MRLSRRGFLAATTVAALPLAPLRATAAPRGALVIGELWGMPYVASAALGNPPTGLRR